MTMAAAEAGSAAFESEEAAAARAGRRATRDDMLNTPRSGARPLGGSPGPSGPGRPPPRYSRSPSLPRSRPPSSGQSAPASGRPSGSGSRRSGVARRAGRGAASAAGLSSPTNYQAVVLGEYILAVLAVAFPPIVRKNTASVSPYSGLDVIQIMAITILYFFLAVLAGTGGSRARFSAWFGGLILLGVGLGETANLTSIVKANNAAAQAAAQPQSNPTTGGSVPSTSATTAAGQPAAAGTTGSSNG